MNPIALHVRAVFIDPEQILPLIAVLRFDFAGADRRHRFRHGLLLARTIAAGGFREVFYETTALCQLVGRQFHPLAEPFGGVVSSARASV